MAYNGRACCQFWNLKYKSLKYILMAIDLQKLEQKFNALFEGDNFVTEFEQWLDARNVSQNCSKPIVSGSLLSEANLERCSNLYAEAENNAYTNDYYGYYNGAKQMGNAILNEIQRRQLLIKSEPDGIVRETMINNLLLDI
jgi:hypothetical protein